MELAFWKYEGAGNDFVMIDGRGKDTDIPGHVIRNLCNRHRGIGADGMIVLCDEPGYDFRMKYYNADGGEVSMCGNGGRCITLFAHHLGIGGEQMHFIGKDGEHYARIISSEEDTATIEVGMIDVDSFEFREGTFFMNTGVPHYVEFVEDLDEVDVVGRGRAIRSSERFRNGGTNVNFVQVLGFGQIKIRTYERGVEDETLACGTGATAGAIATHLFMQNDCNSYAVMTPGGELDVTFEVPDNQHFKGVRLSGPARRVFSGTIKIKF